MLDYQPGGSLLHRMNPILKLLIALLICVACFVTPLHLVVLSGLFVTLLMAAVCGCGKWALGVVKSLAVLSIIIFVIQALCIQNGTALITLPLGVKITDAGLSFSALFVLRLIASALPLALMLRVTKGIDLANALNRNLRVPFKYAFAVSTAIRFIPAFADEMNEIMEAQTARGVALDAKGLKKLRLLIPLCVPLMLSCVRKAQTAAISAELRGASLRK
jgi:energy-coupling factor transport system permease protein